MSLAELAPRSLPQVAGCLAPPPSLPLPPAARYKAGLPLRIVRPSIVGGTSLRHINPGYIGNAGGARKGGMQFLEEGGTAGAGAAHPCPQLVCLPGQLAPRALLPAASYSLLIAVAPQAGLLARPPATRPPSWLATPTPPNPSTWITTPQPPPKNLFCPLLSPLPLPQAPPPLRWALPLACGPAPSSSPST